VGNSSRQSLQRLQGTQLQSNNQTKFAVMHNPKTRYFVMLAITYR